MITDQDLSLFGISFNGIYSSDMTGGKVEREQRALQELLRELRLEAGLRQVDVAKAMNFPQSMVSKYEAGERRLDIPEVRALCEMFGVTLSQFVEKLDNRLR